MQAALLINQSLDDINNGGKVYDGEQVFKELAEKYGKQS
jgi:hypothetical protein